MKIVFATSIDGSDKTELRQKNRNLDTTLKHKRFQMTTYKILFNFVGRFNVFGALRSWGFKAQMFVKALLLIRITNVGVKHFRPNFLKPLLSASAVFKAGSFKF